MTSTVTRKHHRKAAWLSTAAIPSEHQCAQGEKDQPRRRDLQRKLGEAEHEKRRGQRSAQGSSHAGPQVPVGLLSSPKCDDGYGSQKEGVPRQSRLRGRLQV